MKLTPEAFCSFSQHVLQEWPREACGVVVDGTYIPCENTHPEPHQNFRIDPLVQVQHRIQAVLHSHPYKSSDDTRFPPQWASQQDMQHWMGMGCIPWGIVACDGEGVSEMYWLEDDLDKPLIGRTWTHATHDCYALVRDWFWQERQVKLPNYARGMGWWNEREGDGMLVDNFMGAGFVPITPDQVTTGDCILMRYGTRLIAHCGVVTGPNQFLHHLNNRLSGREPLSIYARQASKYVRYQGTP
jgi:cell wall-associated NlpC family hydrolase